MKSFYPILILLLVASYCLAHTNKLRTKDGEDGENGVEGESFKECCIRIAEYFFIHHGKNPTGLQVIEILEDFSSEELNKCAKEKSAVAESSSSIDLDNGRDNEDIEDENICDLLSPEVIEYLMSGSIDYV